MQRVKPRLHPHETTALRMAATFKVRLKELSASPADGQALIRVG